MLDLAARHEKELQDLFSRTAFDEEYKFYDNSTYRDSYKASDSTWNIHEFVSLNDKGEVVGYFKYKISRETLGCYAFSAINFRKDGLNRTFSEDFKQVIIDIFEKFKFNKLNFSVVIGNPAEKMYDKYIHEIGGRIVGIYEEDCKLIDGLLYDAKVYEIMRKNFRVIRT